MTRQKVEILRPAAFFPCILGKPGNRSMQATDAQDKSGAQEQDGEIIFEISEELVV